MLVAISIAAARPALPAPASATDDPEGVVVTELVVQAKAVGPAWWRVSKGGSVVWVMGLPGGLPRSVKWNDAVLDGRLTGARRLIVPSAYNAGLGDLFGALALRQKMKTRDRIEGSLAAAVNARFVSASATLKQPPSHYDGWKPAVAGLLMVGDFRKAAGIDYLQPLKAVQAAARHKGVRVTPAASYKAMPVLKAMAGDLTDQVNLACLEDSLQEIEAGSGRIRSAAEAWARGDVRGALTAERGYEKCLASFPEFNAVVRESIADETAAVAHDLQSPGVSVAAIPLRSLVARDGVLARLQAQGYEVKTPASD